MTEFLLDAYEIAKFIKDATKKTPIKMHIKGDMLNIDFSHVKSFGDQNFRIVFGELSDCMNLLETNKDNIIDYVIENDRRNSAIPLLDLTKVQARIEPGAIIREYATIGKDAVIMMNSTINIGAVIGEKTMIDMNAVVGARAIIGKNCHIGAGAVIAGVLEPPSKTPVIIEDNVLIGANAVVLEGVKVGRNSVVAAGAVVISDVLENQVVAGSPAKLIKMKDEKTEEKTKILDDLRK
jgi:2,3,4,5-tetrahydropyridine-2,6-dicarboxylate N-acetyltransferase